MILTDENYYSDIANQQYMSVSQYKSCHSCAERGVETPQNYSPDGR